MLHQLVSQQGTIFSSLRHPERYLAQPLHQSEDQVDLAMIYIVEGVKKVSVIARTTRSLL
jgi:hypothetical protein